MDFFVTRHKRHAEYPTCLWEWGNVVLLHQIWISNKSIKTGKKGCAVFVANDVCCGVEKK